MVEVGKEIKLMPYDQRYVGKHDGWAFQFLNDNYEGFYPGVCCKDFLQDQIWSDLTQQSMKIYGQTSDYKGIIDKQSILKLVMSPKLFKGVEKPVIDNIKDLASNLQQFLNEIELLMGIKEFSTVESVDNNILIEFSKEWIKKPYLFSLFTLFCRLGIYYDGNLEEYLKNPFNDKRPYLDNCDIYTLKGHYQKLLDLINGKAVIEGKDWIDLKDPDQVHHESGVFDTIHLIKYK